GLRLPPSCRTERAGTAEERGEEIAEAFLLEHRSAAGRARAGAAAELEAARPIRRRPELLPGLPVAAELIVRGTLLRVFQYFVGLLHFLELLLGVFLLADIRMIFTGETAVGLLDVLGGGRT